MRMSRLLAHVSHEFRSELWGLPHIQVSPILSGTRHVLKIGLLTIGPEVITN